MNKLLIIGAGRSASALIQYLLTQADHYKWQVTVADYNLDVAQERVGTHPSGKAVQLDIKSIDQRRPLIQKADVVASLLPSHLHMEVARDCLQFEKHLITASYVSQEMLKLSEEAAARNLIFMGEIGLDPGIDHMSAMQVIDEIRDAGGTIQAFKSYTGGLIAPESDDNPWHYKFTWNPRNVVLAGQGTAQYIENGNLKFIPYHRLFRRYDVVDILGMGQYEMYANRDSLLYRRAYQLEDIPTLIRGTLRHKGFCEAWDAFVQLGLTDDSYPLVHSGQITFRQFIEAYIDDDLEGTLEERVAQALHVASYSELMKKIEWTGIFSDELIGLQNATPAQILESLLLKKWKLRPTDKDMIIMQHEFDYILDGKSYQRVSRMVLTGNHSEDTAMSKLVGLPLGIFIKHVMLDRIQLKGVNIPVMKEVYQPVLEELSTFGVLFEEKITEVS